MNNKENRKCPVWTCTGAAKEHAVMKRKVVSAWLMVLLQWVFSMIPHTQIVQMLLAAVTLFILGSEFFVGACRQITKGRAGMDTLLVLSTTIAFIFSLFHTLFADEGYVVGLFPYHYYAVVTVFIALAWTGRCLELHVKGDFSKEKTDRVAGIYVPVIMVVAVLAFIIWTMTGKVAMGVLSAVSILIIAYPSALLLAVPAALRLGIGKASQQHILVNNAGALAEMSKVDVMVLDKTGTLTEGQATVTGWLWSHSGESVCNDILLAALKASEHPMAPAVIQLLEVEDKVQPAVLDSCQKVRARGVKAVCRQRHYWVGNYKLLQEEGAVINNVMAGMLSHYESDGNEIMYFGRENELLAIIAISDPIKLTSFDAVKELEAEGIEVWMLTSDGERTAQSVASRLGIRYFIADALAEEKADFVSELQRKGKKVAMAGDGVNDIQALKLADVSVAMGEGAHQAKDVAMLTFLTSDLHLLPKVFRMSKQVSRLIDWMLFCSLIFNLLCLPVASGLLYQVDGCLLTPMLVDMLVVLSVVSMMVCLLWARKKITC